MLTQNQQKMKEKDLQKNTTKKNFVLRIDADIYKQLEEWANSEFRSVNGQIEFLLNDALYKTGRKKKTKN